MLYAQIILFHPKKVGEGENRGEECVKEQKKLSGARIELAIYRYHNIAYETIALTS